MPGCTKKFTADTETGLLEQVAEHARADHGLTEIPAELVEQVRARITDV